MNNVKVIVSAAAFSIGLLYSSCAHLDTSPTGSADRVLTGTIVSRSVADLPRDSEVTIRVLDLSAAPGRAEVLGEQTITGGGSLPLPFKVEYHAEDAALMRSVAVEARIAVDGRLRYLTKSAHPLTMSNVDDPHVIEVELAGKH